MNCKSLQMLLIAGAGVIALVFALLMFNISRSMSEMTAYVGTMSGDVGKMQGNMHTMSDSMLRMEKSIQGLGQAFEQGSRQFQQMNPGGMMQQVMPGVGKP